MHQLKVRPTLAHARRSALGRPARGPARRRAGARDCAAPRPDRGRAHRQRHHRQARRHRAQRRTAAGICIQCQRQPAGAGGRRHWRRHRAGHARHHHSGTQARPQELWITQAQPPRPLAGCGPQLMAGCGPQVHTRRADLALAQLTWDCPSDISTDCAACCKCVACCKVHARCMLCRCTSALACWLCLQGSLPSRHMVCHLPICTSGAAGGAHPDHRAGGD